MSGRIKNKADAKIITDKNRTAFGAVNRANIPSDKAEPIAAPMRSDAYNLKLLSEKFLNNCE